MTDDLDPQPELDPEILAALEADLGSAALWAEPPASLEDALVAAITAHAATIAPSPEPRPSTPRWLRAVAAAVFLTVGFGLGALLAGDDSTPDVAGETFVLEGTDLAGDATGTIELAVLGNGLRVILSVDALPAAADGTYYEAWLVGSDQAVISAGTFHMRNETGRIVLWAGVTPEAYPDFVITLEDDDGDPTQAGAPVFVADVSRLVDN